MLHLIRLGCFPHPLVPFLRQFRRVEAVPLLLVQRGAASDVGAACEECRIEESRVGLSEIRLRLTRVDLEGRMGRGNGKGNGEWEEDGKGDEEERGEG
jgi:hypothetical protein